MKPNYEILFTSFKRLIHVLSAGKKTPREYGGVTLHSSEVHVVEVVGSKPGISVSGIADHLGITKGAVSQVISKLLKKQLVEKKINTENMRLHELYLTDLGGVVDAAHTQHEKELVEGILLLLDQCGEKDIELFREIVDMVSEFADH